MKLSRGDVHAVHRLRARGRDDFFNAVQAQIAPGPGSQITEQIDTIGEAGTEERKKDDATKKKSRDILIVPIPHSSPSLGSGLTLMAGVFYNPNNSPEPWVTGIGGMYTSNKSWALGAAHKMSLAHDKKYARYFWSIIAVDTRHMRVLPNPMNKFLLNKESGLQYNQDGSLTLSFGAEKPADAPESNWLPTLGGKDYRFTLRFYGPLGGVVDGTYYPPPIERIA